MRLMRDTISAKNHILKYRVISDPTDSTVRLNTLEKGQTKICCFLFYFNSDSMQDGMILE